MFSKDIFEWVDAILNTPTHPKKKRNWEQDGTATWWKRIDGKEGERKRLLIVPGKKFEQILHQGRKWMARKTHTHTHTHTSRDFPRFSHQEMLIETTISYFYIATEWLKGKLSVGENVYLDLLYTGDGTGEWYSHWKVLWQFHTKLNVWLRSSTHRYVPKRNENILPQKDLYTNVHSTLFIIA